MDVYGVITDKIIAKLEQGNIPWHRPWNNTAGAISHATGNTYSILNQILLGAPGEYLTYPQAEKEGGHVRKGEHGKTVVFWKLLDTEKTDENGVPVISKNTGKPVTEQIPYLKLTTVFRTDQCEGITAKYAKPVTENNNIRPIEAAENVIRDYIDRSGVKLSIRESDEAYYSPMNDEIVVPLPGQFVSSEAYYGVLFHESTHSTGAKNRLNRFGTDMHFGGHDYSCEELVAELGSAFIANRLGFGTVATEENNAAYIQSWLKALRNDKRLIVTASSRAQKAVDMIFGEKAGEAL